MNALFYDRRVVGEQVSKYKQPKYHFVMFFLLNDTDGKEWTKLNRFRIK